ncbi:MAG TPA: hypothetical protein ENJ16_04415 [Planctomycetaceae bacterium]|nr:hypothetical protein [Planctomycetaceae bacterium]
MSNMMMGRRAAVLARGAMVAVLIAGGMITGCSKKKDEVVLTPVKGVVIIDGKPREMVAVRCHPTDKNAKTIASIGQAFTDKNGAFQISSISTGDGLPAGEYVLTFEWGQMNYLTNQYGGPDKLKGRYKDPQQSKVKFKVEENKPVDLGRIELTTS